MAEEYFKRLQEGKRVSNGKAVDRRKKRKNASAAA